jgi:Family of unknown function (DUF6600)
MQVTVLLRRSPGLRTIVSLVFASVMLIGGLSSPVQAEVNVAVEFRTSLEPHGHWSHNDRWGDVWIPAEVEEDWAPYTRGRWVYTDDWGWYWVSEEDEADWGWAVYHYGRWFFDPEEGWIWVPGREWAPAWVTWRRGADRIGWAPQPPDEVYVEVSDNPRYWIFVEARDFNSDRLWTEIEPGWHHTVFLQETVIVNRTVVIRERGPIIAVNPGIEPALIAREMGKPIRTYEVSPVVLEGTADIKGAIEVRPEEAPQKAKEQRVEQTSNLIEPATAQETPQALGPDEKGRLGERPPRAAKEEGGEPTEKAAEGATKPEKPDKEAAEKVTPDEPSEQPDEGKAEKPSPKAAQEGKPDEKGKTVEQTGPEQPSKAAEEEAKPKGKKATTEGKPEQVSPGEEAAPKAAEEKGKRNGKKASTETKPEQVTPKEKAPKAAEEERPKQGKKAVTEGKLGAPEQPGKKAEEQIKPRGGKKAATEGEGKQPAFQEKLRGKEAKPEKPRAAEEGGAPGKGSGEQSNAKPRKKAAKEGKPEQPSDGGPPL